MGACPASPGGRVTTTGPVNDAQAAGDTGSGADAGLGADARSDTESGSDTDAGSGASAAAAAELADGVRPATAAPGVSPSLPVLPARSARQASAAGPEPVTGHTLDSSGATVPSFTAASQSPDVAATLDATPPREVTPPSATAPPFETALERASRLSRYFRKALAADPALAGGLRARWRQPWTAGELRARLAEPEAADEDGLRRALRRLRREVMLTLILRDLNGLADMDEVVTTMTALADCAIQAGVAALDAALAATHGRPCGQDGGPLGLIVVAMGKLGGGELNVSSDVDLVFLYAEEGETAGPRPLSHADYFTRLGRRLIGLLAESTPDGFVFRVDMRLRPYGEAGALAVPLAALENYFITQAREWERYAWVKARVVTPDPADAPDQAAPDQATPGGAHPGQLAAAAAEVMATVRPFVYRKYLDFAAIDAMRRLHAQIAQEVQRRELRDDVKRGPGGIREVEFIAQVFQLIRGGRLPALQCPATRAALARLRERGLLPAGVVDGLAAAYDFLRRLEHRLQYQDDAQTQALPTDPAERALTAAAMGYAGWEEFAAALAAHRAFVGQQFAAVFAERTAPEAHPLAAVWQAPGEHTGRLAALGFAAASSELLNRLAQSQRYLQLPAASRRRFDALMPRAVEAAARLPNPDATLTRLVALMEAIARRESYLALLAEYPAVLALVARLLSASPWAAETLTRRPLLLDELIDEAALYVPPDWPRLEEELAQALAARAGDVEAQMDAARQFRHALVFHFLAQDLTGLLPVETLSDRLSDAADLVLRQALAACWRGVRGRHREAPAFAVIAYGKLGGRELGYDSDLDLVFVYDDDAAEAPVVYARLAQTLNTWLSAQTAAGRLYETDLRLRPNGEAGLLAHSLAAFSEYQRTRAWTWEHQALSRARFAAGDPALGARFEALRREILTRPRDPAALRADVLAMRERMHQGHPNRSGQFDLKHNPGGLVDVEFAVQTLVLAHAHRHAGLTDNVGNLALLDRAAGLGLLPAAVAVAAHDAYRELRRRQHALRLAGVTFARLPADEGRELAAPVRALWEAVFGGDAGS